jgi:Glycosyl transferases group 1
MAPDADGIPHFSRDSTFRCHGYEVLPRPRQSGERLDIPQHPRPPHRVASGRLRSHARIRCGSQLRPLGLPIVASDVPINALALGDGERGTLVSAGDPNQLAAGIRTLMLDRARTEAIATEGQRCAVALEAEIGTEAVAARLHAAYLGVIV